MSVSRFSLISNMMDAFERERASRGLSIVKWAHMLELSTTRYRDMRNFSADMSDFITVYRFYEETGLCLFEAMNYHDDYLDVMRKIHSLNREQLEVVNSLINYLVKMES